MKKINKLILILLIILPMLSYGYVSGLKTWVNDEVLTHTDLNSNIDDLNSGIDDAIADMADSLFLRLLKTSVRDSIDEGISDSLDVRRAAFNDSINARFIDSYPLFFTGAFADSTSTNDSLTVEISKKSPIGTKGALFIDNQQGVAEKITIIIDGIIPSKLATLDSILIPVWSEQIDSTDFVSASVFEDSTAYYFKGTAAASVDSMCSSTARTTVTKSITGIDIVGGSFRLELLIETVSDSMYIGTPEAYLSNP